MSETLTSSFAGQEVNAPIKFREFFQKYSQTTGGSTVAELNRKPFPRMVDFWFLAICVAVRKGLKPVDLDGQETYKAIEGAAIVSPEWRTQALRLIAIAETKNPEVVKDPRQMMRIANGLAFAGMPHLIEILEQNPDDEAFCLADDLVALLG
jgi:hypothetical protein